MMINKDIDNSKEFDWGAASSDYAKYRDIYPDIFYQKIADLGLCTKGQKVLDLGTGTGVLPRNMAKYGAEFTAADISENQIKYAQLLSRGMKIKYLVSSAEDIAFPPESFDVVTACQCFIYFDKKTVMPKIHKILKENGHFLIMFMNWLPFESEIASKSEELVLKYNPEWTGGGMKRVLPSAPEYSDGLFSVSNLIHFDVDLHFTRESWNGRMKACRGIDASLDKNKIADFEREHLIYLETVGESFTIPHFVTMLDLKKI